MKYAAAIQFVLSIDEGAVYEKCRYSLLHKIIQDATYSSTDKWRYRHPDFYWSFGAVEYLADLAGKVFDRKLAPDRLYLELPDGSNARARLRQEHVVPTGVIISHLLHLDFRNQHEVAAVLECARTVCIVTDEENSRLHKNRMPPEQPNFLVDKWSRYEFPRDKKDKIEVSPYSSTWQNNTITFVRRER
jgi:hypothetical protein